MKYLITGGTGSFGQAFTKRLLREKSTKRVRIFSRDEFKQSEMVQSLTDSRLRFLIGDVRDEARVQSACKGIDIVIHAAAMKQVPACEYNPYEAVKTNILGTQNVISACVDQGVKKAIFISTDKAVAPVNLYGATKLVAEKLWLNADKFSDTRFSFTRYGNVVGSRGSVVPLFKKQAVDKCITVTHPDMTRFVISIDEAVEFVWQKLQVMKGGEVFIPPNLPSVNIFKLARYICPDCSIDIVGVRPGEKIHEYLDDNYCSKDNVRPIEELKEYFK